MLFIEFAYNMSIHSITDHLSIKIIYDFNPLTPLDLYLYLLMKWLVLMDIKKAKIVKKLHESV